MAATKASCLILLSLGLILTSLSETAEAGKVLLGSRKCTWGPAYWCKGIPQSKECAATKHCIEKVWQNQVLPEDNDDVCTICKNMVQEARDTLRSNETIDELKQVFEGSCDLIPIKIIADECKVLSDQFIAELVETLSSEMNPQLVCAAAGLCNSARVDKLLDTYYLSLSTTPPPPTTTPPPPRRTVTECDVCNAESDKLAGQINQMPKDDVLDKFLEMCGEADSYSDSCKATTLDNFDLIYDMITNFGDGQLCYLVGLCSETTRDQPAAYTNLASPGDVQCEFCEKVIQHWVDTWTANTTQAEFKQVLEAICRRMDKPDRVNHCLHIVDDYYIPWFNFLLHEIDPQKICTMVGLCGGGGFMKVDSRKPISLLLDTTGRDGQDDDNDNDVGRMTGDDEFGAALGPLDPSQGLVGGFFAPQTALVANKPGCVICEYALHELQQWLGDNRTEAMIEHGVKNLCSRLSANVRDQCSNLVDTYAPALVQLFVHAIDPSEICARLRLCQGDVLLQQASYPVALQLEKRGQDSCALCEYGLQTVFSMLNDSTDRQEIVNVLDSVCYRLPVSVRNECEKLVSEYTSTIIDLILQSFTPDQICAKLSLCEKPKEHSRGLLEQDYTVKDQECVLCEYVITTLEKMIGDKHNAEQVKEALDKLCGYLPKTVSAQCVNFVDTYSTMIIDLISHDLPPDQVCSAIGLCQQGQQQQQEQHRFSPPSPPPPPPSPLPQPFSDDRPYCTLCELAIGEVDKMILDKKNEEEIKSVLDRICYELSAPIKKECIDMVDQYTDKIIQMFVSEYTPEQICIELKLCKPTTRHPVHHVQHLSSTANEIPALSGVTRQEQEEQVSAVTTTGSSSNGGPFCVLCEFAINILEKQILNNRTFEMVERGVQMICSYMPQSVAEPCEEFVDQYGDEIIRIIIQEEADPKLVCTLMAMCVQAQGPRMFDASPLGGNRCAWGPAYWCQSRFHAKACGTTEHCERYGWN